MKFQCSACKAKISVSVDRGGEAVRCPTCRKPLRIPLADGKMVAGYRILKLLGTGGMGSVYLAEQVSMHRNVALKILSPELTGDKAFRTRFDQEVRLHAALNHPRIAIAYDAGNDGSLFYLAMEYIEGKSLEELLRTKGPFSEGQALRIIRHVAVGLSYAWKSAELIHRDIKPSNIMITESGAVKVLDMGVSKSLKNIEGDPSASQFIVGTPQYMPPEQMRGVDGLDHRADMFALGATLYHMLVGHAPFQEKTLEGVLEAQTSGPAPSPRSLRPEISSSCVHLIRVMMAKEPEHRYLYWSSLIADVSRVLSGQKPITKTPAKNESFVATTSSGLSMEQALKRPRDGKVDGVKKNASERSRHYVGELTLVLLVLFLAAVTLPSLLNRKKPPVSPIPEPKEVVVPLVEKAPPPVESNQIASTISALIDEEEIVPPQLEDLYAFVTERIANQPNDFAGHEEDIKQLALEAEFYGFRKYSILADELGQDLLSRKKAFTRQMLQGLESKASDFWAAGKYSQAIEIWATYDGPLKNETQAKRLEREKVYREKNSQRQQVLAQDKEKRKAAVDELYAEFIDQVLTSGFSKALGEKIQESLVANKSDKELRSRVQVLSGIYGAMTQRKKLILATFEQEVGVMVDVDTERGEVSARVVEVSPNEVMLERVLNQGSIGLSLTVEDLTADEKLIRLQRSEDPSAVWALGAFAIELKRYEVAQQVFKAEGSTLGRTFAKRLAPYINSGPQKPASVKTPVGPALVQALKVELAEKNPSYKGGGDFRIEGSSVTAISLQDNVGDIQDLSPLKDLPLTYLGLRGSGIRDLTPLRGMPLKTLILTDTRVSSLEALTGMPLTRLSLAGGSNITSIASCTDMPLAALDIRGTSVESLKPVEKAPISSLMVSELFKTTESFDHFPLVHLDISNSKIRSLIGLRDMALHAISLVNTPIEDVRPLAGMPLSQMRFNPQWIRSGLEDLRRISTLTRIADNEDGEFISRTLFWGRVDSDYYSSPGGDQQGDEKAAESSSQLN